MDDGRVGAAASSLGGSAGDDDPDLAAGPLDDDEPDPADDPADDPAVDEEIAALSPGLTGVDDRHGSQAGVDVVARSRRRGDALRGIGVEVEQDPPVVGATRRSDDSRKCGEADRPGLGDGGEHLLDAVDVPHVAGAEVVTTQDRRTHQGEVPGSSLHLDVDHQRALCGLEHHAVLVGRGSLERFVRGVAEQGEVGAGLPAPAPAEQR